MALAWLGGQYDAMPREPSRTGRGVRREDLGMRRESFNASREALKVDIVVVGKVPQLQLQYWESTSNSKDFVSSRCRYVPRAGTSN